MAVTNPTGGNRQCRLRTMSNTVLAYRALTMHIQLTDGNVSVPFTCCKLEIFDLKIHDIVVRMSAD